MEFPNFLHIAFEDMHAAGPRCAQPFPPGWRKFLIVIDLDQLIISFIVIVINILPWAFERDYRD